MEQIEKNSPRSSSSGRFSFDQEEKKNSKEPNIASLSEASKKPGAFAAMIQKQKNPSKPGEKGLFKSAYNMQEKKEEDDVEMKWG